MSYLSSKTLSRLGQRGAYGVILHHLALTNTNVFAVSADLGHSSGLDRFKLKLPQRFINVGICEQHMVTFAAGLSDTGFNVFISSFAPFLTLRALEQIRVDVSYMNCNVKLVSIGSGVSMGYLGNTHFGLEDIGVIRQIPSIPIYTPSDCIQLYAIVNHLVTFEGPAYLRLTGGSPAIPIYDDSFYISNQGACLHTYGKKLLVISYGSIFSIVQKAILTSSCLEENVSLVDVYCIHPLSDYLRQLIQSYPSVLIIEEHRKHGALYTSITEFLSAYDKTPAVYSLSLPDTFLVNGSYEDILSHYSLDSHSIQKRILSLLSQ